MTQCPECSTEITITDANCPSCNFPVSKLRGLAAATLTQDAEMVAALIQMGADVNSVDQNGRTPLMIASFIGNDDIVEILLAAGANPEFANDAGESALTLAQTKDVQKLLRRAIVVNKFSAARKKEMEDATANQPAQPQEPQIEEEVTPDIAEALTHLEPVVDPPKVSLDCTQPLPVLSEEINSKVPVVHSLDSTQPIPIVFKELEPPTEEDESFIELEPDVEENPPSAEIDQFIQIELQDVQPAMVVESSNEFPLSTLDPTEESLMESPEVQPVTGEIDQFIQSELHAGDVQAPVYFESNQDESSLTLDPMEESLMEPSANSQQTKEDEFLQTELQATDVQLSSQFKAFEEHSLTLDPMEELMMKPPANEPKQDDEFLDTELHAIENFHPASRTDQLLESLDPTEQLLEESENQEIQIELPQEAPIPEPIVEEPRPVFTESPGTHRELPRWEDWKQIEQAVAFAPWKTEDEPEEKIELTQPIEEVIAPKTPEVPPQIFMNSTRTRNIAIGIGAAIFLIPFLLFLSWQVSSKKPSMQTKVITAAPKNETKPKISAPKTTPAKPEPKIAIQKTTPAPPPAPEPAPKKTERRVVAEINHAAPAEVRKKPAKNENKKDQPAVPLIASTKSQPASAEEISKARKLNDQGSDLLRAGKVSEGISLLEQAVHSFPKNTNDESYASALLNLGRAWRMAGRPDISIRILEKRMKINIERDEVARELLAAKRQAVESGMGIKNE